MVEGVQQGPVLVGTFFGKRDMLHEWSTMGLSEKLLRVSKKEYVCTSWCLATLAARYHATNNVQEGMKSGVNCV